MTDDCFPEEELLSHEAARLLIASAGVSAASGSLSSPVNVSAACSLNGWLSDDAAPQCECLVPWTGAACSQRC